MRKGKRNHMTIEVHVCHGGKPPWRDRLKTALISAIAGFTAASGIFQSLL